MSEIKVIFVGDRRCAGAFDHFFHTKGITLVQIEATSVMEELSTGVYKGVLTYQNIPHEDGINDFFLAATENGTRTGEIISAKIREEYANIPIIVLYGIPPWSDSYGNPLCMLIYMDQGTKEVVYDSLQRLLRVAERRETRSR